VPIQGGGRLSGPTAGFNLGLLHIRTDLDAESPVGGLPAAEGDAFSVVRIARELPGRSRVGAFYGHRSATGLGSGHDDRNATYAVDGQVGIGDRVTFTSFAARTETPELDGRDHAFHLSGGYRDRDWFGSLTYRELGEHFNPEIGFVSRRDYRTYQGFLMRYLRPDGGFLREIRPHVSFNSYRGLETGFRQSSYLHLDAHFETEGGAMFSPAINRVSEGLEQPFRITEEVEVQPGMYSGWEAGWRFNTNRSALLSFDGGIDWGHFLSGSRRRSFGTVTVRRGSSATVSFRLDRNDVSLEEGDFEVTLSQLRLGYFFTPRIYLQSLVQYADQQDTWSANVRFGWLNTAGTGLFIVYNDARELDGAGGLSRFGGPPMSRALIIKFTHRFTVWDG
jgi:hypothetical protein